MIKKYIWSWLLILQLIATNLLGQTAFTKNNTISIKKDSLTLKVPPHIGNVSWQFSKTTNNWADIKNATGDSLLISKVDSSGFYRAKILYNSCNPIYSDSTYILRALPPSEETQMKMDAGEINRNVAYFSSISSNTTIKKIDSTRICPTYEITTKDITSNIEPGYLLIDTTGIGRIILIESVIAKKSTSTSVEKVINGIQVGIDYLINDQELDYCSPANRTKSEWNNPLKTPGETVGFNKFTYNAENGSNNITASTASDKLTLNFASKKLWEISSGNSSLTVSLEEGTVSLKPAIDFHAKYNPVAVATKLVAHATNPLLGSASDYLIKGELDNLKLITYNDLDFNFKYKISASLSGDLNDLIKPKKIAEYWYGIAAGPVILSVKTELIAKLTIEGSGEINVTPEIEWNNNIILGVLAQKNGNNLSKDFVWNYDSKKSISSGIEAKVSLKERLEIIPKMEVYVYGLVGLSGEIIPFQEFKANASISNNFPLLYDCSLDIGVDANASFDISAFHIDYLTASLYTRNFNILNKNIYSLPYSLEYISGNSQTGNPEEYLSNPLSVKVVDSRNNIVSNYPVFYDVLFGGGNMESNYSSSNSLGISQNNWKLGNTGPQTVKAYLLNANRTIIDRSRIDFQATVGATVMLPTIATSSISGITQATATSGGSITSDGGTTVVSRGICWSTSQNPTIYNNKTTDGSGTGSFTSNLSGLSANTTYYVRAYAINSQGTAYGEQVSFTTSINLTIPIITTTTVSNITQTTATSGGNITSDGGAAVTSRGVCWSTSQNPTIANSKTTDGSGTGSFTSNLTGLTANTTYYVRAFATNSKGTAYGEQVSFTTSSVGNITGTFTDSRDGKTYKWVKIGTQTWMAENLAYLPVVNPITSVSGTEPRYYVYDYNGSDITIAKQKANYSTYGTLYNWAASKAACPPGWHLPKAEEWIALKNYLVANGYNYDGTLNASKIAKSMAATTNWNASSIIGVIGNNPSLNNKSGFSALPSGYNEKEGFYYSSQIGNGVLWWSSTEDTANVAIEFGLQYDNSDLFQNFSDKAYGFSVRCIKDK